MVAATAWWFLSPPTYAVDPGPFADDPLCADVMAGVPESLLGKDRDRVTGAGAAAWGDASIVMRCGVAPPSPTTNLCMTVNGVDWVLNEARANRDGVKVLRTYGRTPSVEVTFNDTGQLVGGVLVVLNGSLEDLPQKSECLNLSDTSRGRPAG